MACSISFGTSATSDVTSSGSVQKGQSLAGDGPVCGASTYDGSECAWPAGYGREIEDPEPGTPCFMHSSDSDQCGAPTNWDDGCRLPVGYGAAHPREGVCHLNSEVVQKDRDRIKGQFLVAYDELKVIGAVCEAVGVAERTIRVWRKLDEDFDRAVSSFQESLERVRVRALEESMWERAVNGDASAAEVLFYLANRAPGRWQDLKRIRHEVQHGGGVLLVPTSTPDDEREWGELAREQQKQLKERITSNLKLLDDKKSKWVNA